MIRALLRFMGLAAFGITLLLVAAWGVFALWYHTPVQPRWVLPALWCAIAIAALAAPWLGRWHRPTQIVFVAALVALLGWWGTLKPAHQRAWSDDVARLLESDIARNRVVLHNVRNFDWRSQTDYTVRWETREYDLSQLASADLILSYWMGPHIAHTLVSFGFDDGRQVVFSLEIRKEQGEAFSAIAGFFRNYESVLIASDEYDIVRTRTNARGEDVYLYRLNLSRDAVRKLFLGYLGEAEAIRNRPRFYNTLTSNCTTVVHDIARGIAPSLPLDYRLLLSGHLAEYALDQGGLVPGYNYYALQAAGYVSDRAKAYAGPPEGFPRAIRVGIPGIDDARQNVQP
ncbi:MAG: DUF4105 domain-containing protein [Thermomonas sp.]|uniref:Lnb N-terminal periplasmic domain-containing protein n=1 Tax=Thermomonas sp. TaxID=1971895 RepID=UPI0039E4214A